MNYDVVIVGGGPAAHSAALVLGRSRNRVLVCDEARPRNRVATHSHSFFTRDGTPPLELRQIAIEQLATYDTVEFVQDRVAGIGRADNGFQVTFDKREPVTTRLVLLAVGMLDEHPDITGFDELWGDTVIHCPYCHGWEVRDRAWAAYVTNATFLGDLPKLKSWTDDVMAIVQESVDIPADTATRLAAAGIAIERGTIAVLHARDGRLDAIELGDGRQLSRQVLLYPPPQTQTPLVRSLGLELDDGGYVVTNETGQTSDTGIYAAGDVVTPRQQITLAAASGLITGVSMHGVLAKPD